MTTRCRSEDLMNQLHKSPCAPVAYAFHAAKPASRAHTRQSNPPPSSLRHTRRRNNRLKWRVFSIATPAETDLYTTMENELVVVAGATGGVGQIVTAKLLDRLYRVRALARSEEKGKQILGEPKGLQIIGGDCRDNDFVRQAVTGADAIVCCLGTTAFPSFRWTGGSTQETDVKAVNALIENAPESIVRFIFVSSAGVERSGQLPFSILNAFGVLKHKKQAEDKLKASGLPYTIIRPGRLTDGPYTSYDINTLLKATSGSRQDVQISANDDQSGEASRIAVAEAIVQALNIEPAINKTFSISSCEGEGPGEDPEKWKQLLDNL